MWIICLWCLLVVMVWSIGGNVFLDLWSIGGSGSLRMKMNTLFNDDGDYDGHNDGKR